MYPFHDVAPVGGGGAQREQGLRASRGRHELHLHDFIRDEVHLRNPASVSVPQSAVSSVRAHGAFAAAMASFTDRSPYIT